MTTGCPVPPLCVRPPAPLRQEAPKLRCRSRFDARPAARQRPSMDSTPTLPPAAPLSNDAKMWAMLCHLSALSGFIVPFGSLIGPLIIWQLKKNEFPIVDDQGKEALNFQITTLIAAIVSGILIFVAIGFVLLIAVVIASLVLTIIAAIKANNGETYRYPFALRLIK